MQQAWKDGLWRSDASDQFVFDRDELRQFLQFRLAIVKQAKERNRGVFGRFYNRLSGEDPNYIDVSGSQLRQILAVFGEDAAEAVKNTENYQLRADVVQDALDVLQQT